MGLFKQAVKHDAKLRLAIAGPSGSGKTYSALAIATALGGPVAFVDTEHGSASKYADVFAFDVAEMHAPYHPDKFIEAIRQAAEAGYRVIILDSMTHAWNGEGGLLELVEQATKRQKTPNSYTAWHDVTPIQNRLIEAIVMANIHIIATMRSKQEYVQEKDNNGRSTIRKVGMAPIQRDGFEYEFDVFFDMDVDNNAVVSKTRCSALTGKVIAQPGAQVAKILKDWLGGAPAPEPKKQPVDEDFYDASATSQKAAETREGEDEQIDTSDPTEAELATIKQWANRTEAEMWAVMVGACKNEHEARNSMDKSIARCGGKVTKDNYVCVYVDFYRRQQQKLAQAQPEQAA